MKALRFVSIVCGALVLGLTVSHVLQAPGSRGLDVTSWLAVQHTFYGGFAAVGGLAEIVGLAAASVVAVRLRLHGSVAVAHVVAALCMFGTLLVFWFGNRPANDKIESWTPSTVPANWSTYRDQWEAAHAISAVLAAVALLALLVVTIWPRAGDATQKSGMEAGSWVVQR